MRYLITFLEGIVSFLSPCMLPMLPIYISYFAAGEERRGRTLARSAAFVLGFTAVFTALGLGAGTLGVLLSRYQRWVDLVCGLIVIALGLGYLEVIPLPFFQGVQGRRQIGGILSAFLFGMVYSVSLTPCVGAFLGSALMLASTSGGALTGCLLLLAYSLGLGIPFLLSAVLIDQLKGAFAFVKAHYKQLNLICGGFLILVGLLMAFGWLGKLMALFS